MFKAKILLADDAKIFLDIEKDFLRFSPVQIFTAYNGLVALEMARAERPDLVVLDAQMPQMDGVTCCAAIKKDPLIRKVPVLITTTSSSQDDIVRYRDAGCDAIVHKPLHRRQFLDMLHAYLPVIERREPRVTCRMPVTIENDAGSFEGVCHDITMNGLFVATDRDVEARSEIVVSFRLPTAGDSITVARGRVAWRNSAAQRKKATLPPGFGVEFMEITGDGAITARVNDLAAFVMAHRLF